MVLDVSAYNKDKVSDLAMRKLEFFDPQNQRDQLINVLTNLDFGNVRGFDVNLIRRIGNFFNGSVAYTFQVAKGTGSDPRTYLNTLARQQSAITGQPVDPPQAILPTNDNRTHNIAGSLAANFPGDFAPGTAWGAVLRNAGAFATFRFASGLPYTRLINSGGGELAPFTGFGLGALQDEPLNASSMPWIKFFDLRLTKGWQLGGTDWTVFADIRNVFNFRNRNALFAETGDIVNSVHRDAVVDPEVDRLESQAGSWFREVTFADGTRVEAIDLTTGRCATYPDGPVNCVMLKRAEARFGNGDEIYTVDEYTAAFNAHYNLRSGIQNFLGQPRHIRLGVELNF